MQNRKKAFFFVFHFDLMQGMQIFVSKLWKHWVERRLFQVHLHCENSVAKIWFQIQVLTFYTDTIQRSTKLI